MSSISKDGQDAHTQQHLLCIEIVHHYELQGTVIHKNLPVGTLIPLMPDHHNMVVFHVCGIINAFEEQQKSEEV